MNWEQYLVQGTRSKPRHEFIYHMALRTDYEDKEVYFPPTYNQDGFVHATAEPRMLLEVGTHFYKLVLGDWICLKIDVNKLQSPVVYEPAAPVGNTESKQYDDVPLFPHIYGGINSSSVVDIFNIVRSLDGSFESIDGLVGGVEKLKV